MEEEIENAYSSVLNTSHVATIWNFDPNYSLPNLTQVSLPKMFQIVATWLVFSTEEYINMKGKAAIILTMHRWPVFVGRTAANCS